MTAPPPPQPLRAYSGWVLRALGFLAVLALTVYALVDCVRTEDDDVKGLPKIVWVLLIVLAAPVAPLAWLVAGRERLPHRSPARRGPVAPDDDPEFLRSLSERTRRRLDDEHPADGEDGSSSPGPDRP